ELPACNPRITLLDIAQQALLRGDERPASIDVDAAAFEHDPPRLSVHVYGRLPHWDAQPPGDLRRDWSVELPIVVFRPGVEAPRGCGDSREVACRSRNAPYEDWTIVARPNTIRPKVSKFEIARRGARIGGLLWQEIRLYQKSARLRLCRFIIDKDVDAFHAREMANDFRVDQWDRLEFARPVGAIMGPRDPGCLVPLPLGRHAVAKRGGSLGWILRDHGLDHEPLHDLLVRVHSAVAPERPIAANVFYALEVHLGDEHLFLVVRSLGDHLSEGIGNERPAPELKPFTCRLVAPNVARLETHTIRHGDVNAIRNRVGALNGLPGVVLCLAVLRLLVRMPADCRGIEEHVRPLKGGQPRALGIPLVPADQRPKLPEIGFESLESKITLRKVELLVIQRVVGNVHLAIDAQDFAACVDDGRCVVVNPGSAALEQRSDDCDRQLASDFAEALGRWAGNRLGQIEQSHVLTLAEVLGQEKFRQAHDLGAFACGVANVGDGALQVLLRLRRARHLHHANVKVSFRQRSTPPEMRFKNSIQERRSGPQRLLMDDEWLSV